MIHLIGYLEIRSTIIFDSSNGQHTYFGGTDMSENTAAKTKINLRDLDDVACSNVVVSRQIRHLIKKNPSFSEIAIDCWVHGGHYTKFRCKNEQFYWYSEYNEPHIEGLARIDGNADCLYTDEWNKLIIFTFQSMCDSMNGINIEDTPEDLLALAESKLQEILSDDNDEEPTKECNLFGNRIMLHSTH